MVGNWLLLWVVIFSLPLAASRSLAEPPILPDLAQVLDDSARNLPSGVRAALAAKPSPWIVKTHDVGPPTDVNKDIPWHLLDKEKDPRFALPYRGGLGLFNTNADIYWLIGLSVDDKPVSDNPPRRYTDHLTNLAAQRVDLGDIAATVLFLPVTSDTVIAVLEFINPAEQSHDVNVRATCTKPAGENKPAIEEPAAAWGGPTGRYGYGITVTSATCQGISRPDGRSIALRFEERQPHKAEPPGSLLCTMGGGIEPVSVGDDALAHAGPRAELRYKIPVAAGQRTRFIVSLNLHRYGPQRIETANQIVIYPAESDAQALDYSLQAMRAGLAADWHSLVPASFTWYERMPVVSLPNPSWTADMYCAMELPRGNTWSAQGVLRQPWYLLCRVNGHEPYGWWSYGMHAHEHLSTFVVNLTEPPLSQAYLRGHLQVQDADGRIQYGVNWSGRNNHDARLATAPLLAFEAWTNYGWSGDRRFLAEAYEACGKFVRWWRSSARTRNAPGEPARPRAGGPSFEDATLQHWFDFIETVRDDGDLATWKATGKAEQQEALDLNCYLLNEERTLAVMARELGRSDEAARWNVEADARMQIMRRELYHAGDGVYYGRDLTSGKWAQVLDISTFFPLWCGLATPEQAVRIAALLHDPQAFGTDYPIATLAVKHMPDRLRGQWHWRGANWVEMTFLAVQGLRRYGQYDQAARVAEANCRMVFDTLEKTGHFREFYNSLTGQPSDLTDYIWTSMPAAFIVEVFFGIRPSAEGVEILPALPAGWNDIRMDRLHVRNAIVSLHVRCDPAVSATTVRINGQPADVLAGRGAHVPWSRLTGPCEIDIVQPASIPDSGR